MALATFAAGCFWGVEKAFDGLKGVISTRVGYTGGVASRPTYKEVCSGDTGHAEAIEVTFDPSQITYKELLEVFWSIHDPTILNSQGADIGSQYRSAIFAHNEEQLFLAQSSKLMMQKRFNTPIQTQISLVETFYEAESYHQKHTKKGK